MFHPATLKLLVLQWRGGLRRFRQGLRTYRGLFQLAFTVGVVAYLAGSMFVVRGFSSTQSPTLQAFAQPIDGVLALTLLLATCYSVLFSTGDATVHFTPSEVAFLFPAPVSRRQLLAYQLLKSSIGIAAIALMFTIMTPAPISLIPARFIAVFLTVSFLSLLTMNVAFIRQVAEEKLHALVRRLLAVVIGVMIFAAANQTAVSVSGISFIDFAKAFEQSTAGALLLAPFQVFVKALRAADWFSFLAPAAALLLVDMGLMFLAFRLDSFSLEAALAISEKNAARLKMVQTKGVWQALASTGPGVSRRRVPLPPFCGGVGPVLWQRMTTTFRSSSRLLSLLCAGIIGVAAFVYMIAKSNSPSAMAPVAGCVCLGYLTLLISLSMQNDIERVGFLKSLPLRSTSIVLGDLIGFPILMAVVQSLFILGEVFFFPEFAEGLICAAGLTIPFNLMMFGVDKLVFYVYPTRLFKTSPGDFQAAGKQMIFLMLKMMMLGAAAILVAIVTVPVAILLESPLATVGAAGMVLVIECAVLLPLLTLAFDRFDPSVTQVG